MLQNINVKGSKLTNMLSATQEPKSIKVTEISDNEQNELSSPLVRPHTKKQKTLPFTISNDNNKEEMLYAFQTSQESKNIHNFLSMSLDEQEFNGYFPAEKKNLTIDDFNYTNKQNKMSKNIKKLIVFDKLSDSFWRIEYKEVVKELIPATLYPFPKE
ncbi:8239_t:CDS:2 [Scutellospora calospora]|uniref:8239_t:CDS:1 n=1 Tax=Scutellospora calospora TaxID=85575 RepID=A0ACA9L348_9GLOM|nr:8239_t:CDS:2 [Scutellospora calospora]